MDLMKNAMYLQQHRGFGQDDDPIMGAVGKMATGLGLIGKVQDMSDQIAVRSRQEQIFNGLQETGGNFDALDPELFKGRVGSIAGASAVKAWGETEAGKVAIAKASMTMAKHNWDTITGAVRGADQAIQSGDMDSAGQQLAMASKMVNAPYNYEYKGNGQFSEVYQSAKAGGPVDTGRTLTMDEMRANVQKLMSNSKEFNRMSVLHNVAMTEENLRVAGDPNSWHEAKGKDGKWQALIPFKNVDPKNGLSVMWRNPDTGKIYRSTEEMKADGLGDLNTRAGSLKRDQQVVQAEKAQAAAQVAEARAAAAGSSAAVARERLALAREQAEMEKQKNELKGDVDVVKLANDTFEKTLAAQGLQRKNGGLIDSDGVQLDQDDPRAVAALHAARNAQVQVLSGLGSPRVQGLGAQPEAPKANPYAGTVRKALGLN